MESQTLALLELYRLSPNQKLSAQIHLSADLYAVNCGYIKQLQPVDYYVREASDTDPSHLRLVPAESDARLLSMDAQGLTTRKIANDLNREGYLVERLRPRRWSPSLIRDVLAVLKRGA